MPRVAEPYNFKQLKWAQKNLDKTNTRISRLLTARKNWEKRVKYYSKLAAEDVARAEAQKLATKILQEKQATEDATLNAALGEGRRFRND